MERGSERKSTGTGISLIIPCWKDISPAVAFGRKWVSHPLIEEVIIAAAPGTTSEPVDCEITVCRSEQVGRGLQMNVGATEAKGAMLLFHHVDSQLTEQHLRSLVEAARDPSVVGGAFYRKFDERHPSLLWAERIERWHSRTFGALYGDQSIFVRRDHFVRLGGFASIPLMEDVEFTLRLRRSGKLALLDPPMSSSPARQIAHGAWRTTGRNMLFLFFFRLGVPASFLHAWYYRHAEKIESEVRRPADDKQHDVDGLARLEGDQRA